MEIHGIGSINSINLGLLLLPRHLHPWQARDCWAGRLLGGQSGSHLIAGNSAVILAVEQAGGSGIKQEHEVK